MSRLTEKDYWEGLYQATPAIAAEEVSPPERKRLLKRTGYRRMTIICFGTGYFPACYR